MKKLLFISLLITSFSILGQNIRHVYMYVKMDAKHSFYDGSLNEVWTFGYYDPVTHFKQPVSLPGPMLEFNAGDSVIVHFWNDAGESHTIHMHGLDVNQANDGVPTTSAAVLPFDSTTYHFRANHPGNYLYHCHIQTSIHLQMGMYGGIRVWDTPGTLFPGGPAFTDHGEYLASDMYAYWNENIVTDYFMINGYQSQQTGLHQNEVIYVDQDEPYLLNLFNIGYSYTDFIIPQELNATIFTSDGRPIPSPIHVDSIRIYPGERYGLILKPTSTYNGSIQVKYRTMFEGQLLYTNDIWVNLFPSSIEDVTESSFEIYPNPAKSHLRISTSSLDSEITIYDLQGRVFKQIPLFDRETTLNTSSWSSGTYLIRIGNDTQKVIIE